MIIGADDHLLKTFYSLMVYIERNKKPGDVIIFNILRNNVSMNISVTLGIRPPPA